MKEKMKYLVTVMMAVVFCVMTAGCGTKGSEQIANPWKYDASAEDVRNLVNEEFIVPEGAENVSYGILESEKLAEMQFDLDGMEYCARMKVCDGFEDISGMNYKWDTEMKDDINGTEATERRAVSGDETVDNILWYDKEKGIMYSLSTSGKDLDGYDIVGIVYMMQ